MLKMKLKLVLKRKSKIDIKKEDKFGAKREAKPDAMLTCHLMSTLAMGSHAKLK